MSAAIGEHAIIGDGRSAALVTTGGSIDWLCWPRFDSPAVLAGLLDAARGGSWRIAPAGPSRSSRAYLPDSNVLVTRLETDGGVIRITDLMPVCDEADKRRLLVAEHELLRVIDCERGVVDVDIAFEPRLDYGRRATVLRATPGLGIRIEDGARLYTLRSEVELRVDAGGARARVRLRAGDRRRLSLAYDEDGPAVLPALGAAADEAIDRSADWWRRWAGRCTYQGPHRDAVVRSLLALKLLSYAPSGAIVAAPTTSLPERIGGDLNWDYRFCWLRDAAFTVRALHDLGYADDAGAFVGWLLHTTRLTRPELRVLYDVFGGLPGDEQQLDHLEGHRGSRPVRIHNAAAGQLQLDTYGEVIDAVAAMARRGARLDRDTQEMLREFGDFVGHHWWRADQGIWEPRGSAREYTHSRLLCWVALDRLLELHRGGQLRRLAAADAERVRALIRRDLEERAWSPVLGAYTQTLGGGAVDASQLLMSWYGYADAADPRQRSTHRCIRRRLGAGPGLLYRNEQSRAAGEGAFGICSFWEVEFLARGGGSLEEAEQQLARLIRLATDVGLYGEEIDPARSEPLGNFPQAFTHVGLIGAALAVEARRQAERGQAVVVAPATAAEGRR